MKVKINSLILGTIIFICLPSLVQATAMKQNNERKLDNTYAQQSYHQREQDYIGYRRYEESQKQQAEIARQQAEIARQNQIQGWRDSIPALERERNYLALSKTLYWLQDLDKALDSANRAIQSEPSAARAHWLRGDINVKLRNIKGALVDYNRAIAIEPDFHPYYVSRSLLKKGFDRGGAIQDIRIAIKLVSVDNRFNLIRDSEVASLLKELRSLGATQ
jgi:tetratricopeptide (TPR) repeat protein